MWGKFLSGHHCNSSSLKLMEMTKESKDEIIEEDEALHDKLVEISLHAILGKSLATTMKVKGNLLSKLLLILMDSGSTHNFVSSKVVADLGLIAEKVYPFGVQVGDGSMVSCDSFSRQLEVSVQNLTIRDDFYPFTLKRIDSKCS